MKYYNDYPKEPIGGGNPYYMCARCGVSDPAINGRLENHMEWCEYRKHKETAEQLELAKLEIECLKLEAQSPLWAVILICTDYAADGVDLHTLRLFRNEKDALSYKVELEQTKISDPETEFVDVIQLPVT